MNPSRKLAALGASLVAALPLALAAGPAAAATDNRIYLRSDSAYAINVYSDENCSVSQQVIQPGQYSPQNDNSYRVNAPHRFKLGDGLYQPRDGYWGVPPYGPMNGCLHRYGTPTKVMTVYVAPAD